jgi:hypothetical protein
MSSQWYSFKNSFAPLFPRAEQVICLRGSETTGTAGLDRTRGCLRLRRFGIDINIKDVRTGISNCAALRRHPREPHMCRPDSQGEVSCSERVLGGFTYRARRCVLELQLSRSSGPTMKNKFEGQGRTLLPY